MKFIDLSSEDRKERVKLVLRYLVFHSGYSQRSIAIKLDINRSTAGHILTGERSLSFVDSIDWFEALAVTPKRFYNLLDKGVPIEEDWTKD